jgi:hypothetical protein
VGPPLPKGVRNLLHGCGKMAPRPVCHRRVGQTSEPATITRTLPRLRVVPSMNARLLRGNGLIEDREYKTFSVVRSPSDNSR